MEVKELYTDNYQTLMKENENNTNKWKDILCSWLEELILLKCPTMIKIISGSNAIYTKISITF
jgi:hypothetical protein